MNSLRPQRKVGLHLTEYIRNCEGTGGEEQRFHDIEDKDGWLPFSEAAKRGDNQGVTVEREDAPSGGESRFMRIPPQHRMYHRYFLECPPGTRVRRTEKSPDFADPDDEWPAEGVLRGTKQTIFVVTATGELRNEEFVPRSPHIRLVRKPEAVERPVTPEETARRAAALLAMLNDPPISSTSLVEVTTPTTKSRRA